MMHRKPVGASRVVLFASLMAIVATACSGSGDEPLEIGLKRSALDLVFKEQDGESGQEQQPANPPEALVPEPPPPETPEPEPESMPTDDFSPPPPVETCPEAGPGATPDDPVTTTIENPPQEGVYSYHNEGTFEVEGPVPLEGPYPKRTTREIEVLDHPDGEKMRFKVTERGFGQIVTERTYRVTVPGATGGNPNLQLVRFHQESQRGEMTFEPTPPVTIVGLGEGEGRSWNSAGMDPETGASMVVQGEIEKRERVDVCGEIYDTYRVISEETMLNVGTGFQRETDEPTVYNVATHLGGLFLQKDVKSTTTWQTESGPVTLRVDYVSTADSAEPSA